MDISNITDEKELKALAYDQLVIQEQTTNNLKAIHTRLAELAEESSKSPNTKKAKK